MASWDGSYYGPEDPNYYSYPVQGANGSEAQNCTYYPQNRPHNYPQNWPNAFPRNRPNTFTQNGPGTFAQNGPNTFQQHGPNTFQNEPNMTAAIPSNATMYADQQISKAENIPQAFFENNRVQPNLPPFNCKSKNNSSGTRKKYNANSETAITRTKRVDPSVVENSNLHPTAGEFIPNSMKVAQGNGAPAPLETVGLTSENLKSSSEVGTANASLPENRNRRGERNDRRYEKQQNVGYKQRDFPDNQHQQNPNSYRNSYKNANPKSRGRFQNERYGSARQYQDNKRYSDDKDNGRKNVAAESAALSNNFEGNRDSEVHANEEDRKLNDAKSNKNFNKNSAYDDGALPTTSRHEKVKPSNRVPKHYNGHTNDSSHSGHNLESEHSQSSLRSARRYFNEDRNERYRDKRDWHNDRYETGNGREKKSSYQDYNGYRSNNYDREERGERIRDKERNKDKDGSREIRDKEVENWRHKSEDNSRGSTPKRVNNKRHEKDDDASQRERLTEQLNRGQLECLVCCERVKQNDQVWSCRNCYHVLHLKCIKKWAQSSQADNGWRCPACQNVTPVIPEDYLCFCGKTRAPEWNRRDVAHSCGDICGRWRLETNCVHKCTLLCHPGPCPPCVAMVTKHCGCGRTSQTLKCSTGKSLQCDSLCEKPLNCGEHTCEKKCHHGECGDCDKRVHQECYCGKHNREVPCVAHVLTTYTCDNLCDKLLECGHHKCEALCHPGPCEPCFLMPEAVKHCCCGQTPLTEPRKSCLDEIPTCEKVCCKRLKCGQPSNPHMCKVQCHHGECPECELTTKVKCRCGNMDKEIPCKELTTKADDARCQKRCTKKRSCGRHKCNQLCCIDIEHICPLPCSKTLSCGRHKCEQTCHKVRCQPCWRSSFEELYCECGAAVIYPPVPCGTRRPACEKPCSRQHACEHPALHNCHSEPACPPCSVLTQKWCYGNHELRKAVPCHVNEVSCGLPCSKPLSCGRHKCVTICHPGACEKQGQVCMQPCTVVRELCSHMCGAPCHDGRCPETPCKEMVKVTCQCGHRSMSRACAENSRDFQRIASGILASKMAEMQLGHSVDLEEVLGQGAKKMNQLKTLECNDECKMIERNRRLALGLQIVNPDLSGKLMPRYSDFMKQWAKRDAHFCQMVHDKLTELVQLAKTSKQKSRSYSFESMNRDKRHLVHEYCEHFGCESQAYDQEPKRNVVATAVKDKCWLPSLSLLELIQRESGQRRVPGPMLNSSKAVTSLRNVEVLPLPTKKGHKVQPAPLVSKSPEPEIDYFDFQG